MDDPFPEAPPVDPSVLHIMAKHADRVVAWLENEQAEGARHGHPPESVSDRVAGWRFVADAMREWHG